MRKLRPKVQRVCEYCARSFEWRVGLGQGRYCCPECWRDAQKAARHTLICSFCHRVFSVSPSSYDRGEGKYCSRECYYADGASRRTPLEERFWLYVQKSDGCWNWTGGLSSKGYAILKGEGGDGKRLQSSRVSWEIHNGPIPPGLFVCHRCDNPKCVRPDHLFLGTQTDNMQDCIRKGRHINCKRQLRALTLPG